MAIQDSSKLDLLYKKDIFGVTETSTTKASNEESIASPAIMLGNLIWQKAAQIPFVAGPVPDVVDDHPNGVFLVKDPTVTSSQTWLAVRDPAGDPNDQSNRIKDFIPFTVAPSYEAKVFTDLAHTTRLLPTSPGFEWIFDYSAGVLYFPNSVPGGGATAPMYLTGYSYVGPKGLDNLGGIKSAQTIAFQTISLAPNQSQQFTLATGAVFLLQYLEVDVPCRVENHSTSQYNDTNPYAFVSTTSHLIDDGSFQTAGQTFYGPRFVTLMNTESPSSGVSFWKVTNTTTDTQEVNLIITVLQMSS